MRFVAHSLVSILVSAFVGRFSTLALLRRYEKRLLSGVRNPLAVSVARGTVEIIGSEGEMWFLKGL
jgi:hypothetical protein